MRFRKLGLVALAAMLAVAGLAGCRTNVGTAASVGKSRISESDVNRYINRQGPNASLVSQARKQGQDVAPKSEVLQALVQDKLFRRVLAKNGGVPSAGELAASRDAAAALLFQTQLTGKALTAALVTGLVRTGIRASFAQEYLTVQSLEYTIIKRENLSQFSDLAKLVKQTGARVSISGRYGKWDAATLQVNRAAAVPSYLKLQPTPGASASSQPSTGGGS
ncbi:hypothetical protein [uncultured Jatrophihabitans sp.]|uniref:hypothetical protein n=1 Tax=uncultured Jatrophihabitans sp. TaxID=1610747 RepID=UPI0035CC0AA7